MNFEDLEKLGVSGVGISILIFCVRWLIKELEATKKKVDESEKYNRERDKQDQDIIRNLSGVIKDSTNKNERILEKLKDISSILEKLR